MCHLFYPLFSVNMCGALTRLQEIGYDAFPQDSHRCGGGQQWGNAQMGHAMIHCVRTVLEKLHRCYGDRERGP